MTAVAWRIAVEASGYAANDLSGAGAMHSGGRWNSPGHPMVYASSSIALAVLETLSYIGKEALPFDRYLVRIDIPDDIWKRRKAPKFFPAGWDAIPAGLTSRRYGDKWCKSKKSLLLVVPSVIIPDELNILINPLHPEAAGMSATTVKRWVFDPRFF